MNKSEPENKRHSMFRGMLLESYSFSKRDAVQKTVGSNGPICQNTMAQPRAPLF